MARSRGTAQLDLFGRLPPVFATATDQAPVWTTEVESLARQLHPLIHLGTSSWTFPGWAGICYPPRVTDAQLLRDGLSLYTRFPLFRTVGIDRTYYKPMLREELAEYAAQLPPDFRCTEKVWERIVMPVYPVHPRYGIHAGQRNPSFLDAALFHDEVHAPHVGLFDRHLATYILEFPPMAPGMRPAPEVFATRLARFLDEAPYGPRYAVELRNRELLSEAHFRVLRERNVAHVYNYWTHMPLIRDQLDLADPPGDQLVARLMIRPGASYEQRKAEFAPFDRIQDPSEEMREDVVRLAQTALRRGQKLFIIIDNKAEGSSPLSVIELAKRLKSLA
jgi:uncharacterized protein YecE (DUF72 family)